jgi:hypothetical protein
MVTSIALAATAAEEPGHSHRIEFTTRAAYTEVMPAHWLLTRPSGLLRGRLSGVKPYLSTEHAFPWKQAEQRAENLPQKPAAGFTAQRI